MLLLLLLQMTLEILLKDQSKERNNSQFKGCLQSTLLLKPWDHVRHDTLIAAYSDAHLC